MNKRLYNIGRSLAVIALSLATLTACEKDDKSNPTFQQPAEGSFILNVPGLAKGDNIYDLSKSESVSLTCTQPAYGMPLKTYYQVQVSLDERFSNTDIEGVAYRTLKTSYNQATMHVDGVELNKAVVKLYQGSHNGADPSGIVMPIYIRLRAHVGVEINQLGWINSNVVKLPKVVASYVATTPTEFFMRGTSIKGGKNAKELGAIVGTKGEFTGLFYAAAGSTFTFGDDEDTGDGWSAIATLNDNASAGLSEGDGGTVKVANAGWYAVHFLNEVNEAENKLVTTLNIYPAHAYVIGQGCGGNWDDSNPAWEMIAPADASQPWVSPAFTGSGELRAYIKLPGIEWWKTEYTLTGSKPKSITWRGVKYNINSNWKEDAGPSFSVAVEPGMKLFVDFDSDTGKVDTKWE